MGRTPLKFRLVASLRTSRDFVRKLNRLIAVTGAGAFAHAVKKTGTL